MPIKSRLPAPTERPWLMHAVSAGGVGLSAALAGVGVCGLVGFASPLAVVGSVILILATLLAEIAASRLPLHAQRRFSEGDWIKGLAVGAGFCALTAWNVIAGHFGMQAIDAASVRDVRAPLETAAASADAARETAEEALAAFDAETRQQNESMGLALRGAFESGYVTSAARNAQAASESRSERRVGLAQAVSDARAADRAAERALEAAPRPRADIELWLFAGILELIKGALVWFSTASERRLRGQNVLQCNTQSDPRLMSPSERREAKRAAASMLATLRHLERAMA